KGNVEVIDMRTLIPYDWETIKTSTQKTGRVLYVNEETEIANFAEHLIRRTVDELFYELVVSPKLLCGKAVPGIALNQDLEKFSVPQKPDVERALLNLLKEDA